MERSMSPVEDVTVVVARRSMLRSGALGIVAVSLPRAAAASSEDLEVSGSEFRITEAVPGDSSVTLTWVDSEA
jgi:hypothetical protein